MVEILTHLSFTPPFIVNQFLSFPFILTLFLLSTQKNLLISLIAYNLHHTSLELATKFYIHTIICFLKIFNQLPYGKHLIHAIFASSKTMLPINNHHTICVFYTQPLKILLYIYYWLNSIDLSFYNSYIHLFIIPFLIKENHHFLLPIPEHCFIFKEIVVYLSYIFYHTLLFLLFF